MAKLLKLRRGTTTQHGSFTGAEGEVTIDTTKDTAVVHDGSQAGGRPLLREDMSNLPAGTIDNADVNASAAISGTKISPDFGSQDITTTGKVKFANVYTNESDLPSASTYHGMFAHVHNTGQAYYSHGGVWHKLSRSNAPDFTGGIDVTGAVAATGNISGVGGTFTGNLVVNGSAGLKIENSYPRIFLTDTDNNSDYSLINNNGTFLIYDDTNNINRLSIDASGGTFIRGNITTDGTVDGRDVAADGTKLDGIESGSTADQTAAEILTAIKTVDGASSGLDADSVDGIHASSFVRNDVASQSVTGTFIVGINGSESSITMKDSDNGDRQIHNNSNQIGFLTQSGGWGCYADDNGNWTAVGNVTAYSDSRLKTDISTINDALGICGKLRGVSYKWIATDKPSIGVIAQEIEEVIPEVVLTNRETNPATGETTEIKSVDYGKIVGVLINAINELKAEVDELKKPKKKGGK